MRPVASKFPVTLGYRQKARFDPNYIHRGVDYGCPSGSVVVAAKTGKVVHAGYGGMGKAFGNHVILKTGGIYHIYAHLSAETVTVGREVAIGAQVGRSGKTGNVTGAHLHYGEFTSYHYKADRKPEFLDDSKPAPPKPVDPADPWFRLCLWPLAGFDTVYGKKNWTKLEPKIVAEIDRFDCAITGCTEIPEPRRDAFGKKLEAVGHKIVISQDGRSIIAKEAVKVGRTKVVTLKEQGPSKDDKQVVMAELWPSGPHAVVVAVGHLEQRVGDKYDEVRVTQAKQERAAVSAFAKTCKVPDDRVFFADDENSEGWVLEQAYEPDYVDSFDQAEKRVGSTLATITGWDGKASKGDRTDRVKVHKNRPVVSATIPTSTVKKKLTDHAATIVVVGKK